MKESSNIDKEKDEECFHSLVNLDSSDWKVETDNGIQPFEKSLGIYEKDFNPAKSTAKYKWIVLILISVIILVGIFFLVKWYKISSQPNDLSLSGETVYFGSDESTEGFISNFKDDKKQEKTTSKIGGFISTIIGYEDEEVTEYIEDLTDYSTDKEVSVPDEVETEKLEEVTPDENKPTKEYSTNKQEKVKPVSQWSKHEILDYYNKAVLATDEKDPQGKTKMVLGYGGKITADGGLGGALKVISPVIDSALTRNSTLISDIPGHGEIKLSDLKSIKATEKNDVIIVEFVGEEQTDGPTTDCSQGPVGRVMGTLGNIDRALTELGAEIRFGRETVSLTYTDVTVEANIDAKTGIITGGTWHYLVNILIKEADIKLIIPLSVKNLRAAVDYTVTF